MWCGSVQGLSHPVIVDGHAADHKILSLLDYEALALKESPGELTGLGEQVPDSLLAGRSLYGVIKPRRDPCPAASGAQNTRSMCPFCSRSI